MKLSQIIKMFMDIDEPQIKIDKKIYKEQEGAMLKCEDALRSAFKDDKTFIMNWTTRFGLITPL